MKEAKKSKRKYDGDTQSLMTHRQLVLAKFKRHKLAMVALVLLILMYLLCIFSDFFAPVRPFGTLYRILCHAAPVPAYL